MLSAINSLPREPELVDGYTRRGEISSEVEKGLEEFLDVFVMKGGGEKGVGGGRTFA